MTKTSISENTNASFGGFGLFDKDKGKNYGIFWSFFETGFLLLILYLPFQLAMNLSADIDLASGRVLILIFFLIWLLISLISKKRLFLLSFQGIGLVIFLTINGISLLLAQELEWGLRKLLFFLSIFPLYFLTVSFASRRESLKKIVRILILAAVIISLVGLVQFFSQFLFGSEGIAQLYSQKLGPLFWGEAFSSMVSENPSWFVDAAGKTLMRAFGLFPDPHMMAFFLGLILPLAFSLFLFEQRHQIKWLSVCSLLFAVLLLTFSRGGYFGILFAAIAVLALAWRFLKKRKKVLILASLVLSIFILAVFAQPVLGRFVASFSLSEGSSQGRLEIWQDSWQVFLEHSLTGVGLGNYSREISPLADYRNPITSHNLYLDILSETGIFSLAVWLVLIFGSLYQLKKSIKIKEGRIDKFLPVKIGLFGSLSYFVIHSIFETAVFNVVILAFLMIIFALINASLRYEHTA